MDHDRQSLDAWQILERKQRTKRALANLAEWLGVRNASPTRSRGTLIVLMYHSIHPTNALSTRPEDFECQLNYLAETCTIIPLDAVPYLAPSNTSRPTVAVTFDDGYEDSWLFAWPSLRKRCLPATFFICTGFLNGMQSVRDRFKSYARLSPLSWEMVRKLRAEGATIGCHSDSHKSLSKLPLKQALADVQLSKSILETEIQGKVTTFAFPYGFPGTYSKALVTSLAEMGFLIICTAEWGSEPLPCRPPMEASSVYSLRRIRIDPQDTLNDFKGKLNGHWNYIRWGQSGRLWMQWIGFPIKNPQVIL